MSLNSEIQNYNDGLLDAYSAVNTKGGTVPANKNLDNLPTAINSVPSGGSASDFYHLAIDSDGYELVHLVKSIPATIYVDNAVTNLNELFRNAIYMEGGITLSGGGSITSVYGAFREAAVSTIDLSGLSFSANGVDLSYLAYYAPNLTNLSMPHNIKVTNLSNLLRANNVSDSSPASVDFSGWDTSTSTSFAYAFGYRTGTTTINISGWTNPNSASTQGIFQRTDSLTTLIIDSPEVFNLSGSNPFTGSGIASGTGYVYVPDNLVSSYQAANVWSTYASQIKGLSELPA